MDIESLKSHGSRFIDSKDFQSALPVYQQIVSREPAVLPYFRLAQCHYKLKDYPMAIKATTQAFEVMQGIEDFLNTYLKFMKILAKSYEILGEKSLARKAYSQIIEKTQNPDTIRKAQQKIESLQGSTPIEEYKDVINLTEVAPKSEGSLWHLVSKQWYDNWASYCTETDKPHPGAIVNSDIVDNVPTNFLIDPLESKGYANIYLKPSLIQNKDYVILPKQAYHQLEKSYTAEEPVIRRWNVALDDLGTMNAVEVYLKPLKFAVIPTNREILLSQISSKETLEALQEKIIRLAAPQAKIEQTRLWKAPPECDPSFSFEALSSLALELLEFKKQVIEDAEIADEDVIILELKIEGEPYQLSSPASELCTHCKTPRKLLTCSGCRQVKYCSTHCQKQDYPSHRDLCVKIQNSRHFSQRLTNGLQNLGFTCYMNAAIQCLAHSYELSEYFVSKIFEADINTQNPLGTSGALAKAYYGLLMDLWQDRGKVAPWGFKKVLNRVTNQFAGHQQHDSHELLSFVLSGLHQDTNRVINKPYIEQPQCDGKSDPEAAADMWNWFLLRNNSKIVEMMYGQCKSQLLCPQCSKQSTIFDPFLSLSVPIPIYEQVDVKLYVVSENISSYNISINSTQTLGDLKRLIQNRLGFPVIIACYHNYSLKGMLSDDAELGDIKSRTLIAYRCPEDMNEFQVVPVLIIGSGRKMKKSSNKRLISYIRLMIVHKYTTTQDLHNKMKQMVGDCESQIRIVNSSGSSNSLFFSNKLACDFCGSKNCNNCELQISTEITVQKLIEKMQNSEEPLAFEIVVNQPKRFRCQFDNLPIQVIQDENLVIKSATTLQDCIQRLSTPERLSKSNEWYCKHCQEHVQAFKTYEVYRAPNTLIIQLLRFKHRFIWIDKISSLVKFPFKLDLSSNIIDSDSPKVFELYGVVNHYGVMGAGHYTAYVKVNGQWYDFDDSRVSKMGSEDVVTKAAYLLFYRAISQEFRMNLKKQLYIFQSLFNFLRI